MNSKVYLLIYNSSVGSRDAVLESLKSMSHVDIWRYDMDNVFYIISRSSAQDLSDEFRSLMPKGRFMFSEINVENSQGYMTKETWHLLIQLTLHDNDKQ